MENLENSKINLKTDVKYVKGVGPTRVQSLNKLGIFSVEDLITYYPRAYEDRSQIKQISDVVDGEKVTIEANIISGVNVRMMGRYKSIEKAVISDGSESCVITWFNQPYLQKQLKRGETYRFYGKMTVKSGIRELNTPSFDTLETHNNTGLIIPIYPLTEDIKASTIRRIMKECLNNIGTLEETIPEYIINEYNLFNYDKATRQIHFPETFEEFNKARKRLVFDELLSMQLGLLKLRGENNNEIKGIQYNEDVKMSDVINDLPFRLTSAQLRVLEDINNDMEKSKPMNRLLQGDVGSGKTVVAMIAAYKAVKSGYQATIMAPTMILAKQHMENFTKILSKYDIKCGLLVGGMTAKQKNSLLEQVEKGEIDILIGTHAILEENVIFNKLGLVVTDEQHRFGVKQRSIIASKGINPDILVMTATPIPRTLALILYGDLDISIIDELPPNRKKVETYAVTSKMSQRVNEFIKKEIDSGRQAYIVCPLVEESEENNIEIVTDEKTGEQRIKITKGSGQPSNLKAVTKLTEKYQSGIFANYRVECLHGRMKPKEKEEIMERFKNGEIDILISTTVIEVGVDVPNASIMVVENSERFGLAQLHQLRGRVGRGEYKSYCILKYESSSEIVKERLELMTKSDNGFEIAEKDLELRGSGDFFGTKQHGLPEFKIANLFQDMEALKEIQALAIEIIGKDPKLEKEENKLLNKLVTNKFTSKEELTI